MNHLDTILFAAGAVLAIAWLVARSWYLRVLRDLEKMEDDCLNDEDMRDEP